MELKFQKHISMLNNDLESVDLENRILKELAHSVRKDVDEMRNDI